MSRIPLSFLFCLAIASWLTPTALPHDLPISFIDLHVKDTGIEATIEASARNFVREIPGTEEEALIKTAITPNQKNQLLALIDSQLNLASHGEKLKPDLGEIEALPDRKDLRLRIHFAGRVGSTLQVHCNLFLVEPDHHIFFNIYKEGKLQHQEIVGRNNRRFQYSLGSAHEVLAVIRQFVLEGVHHIFIGPDHILFIIGLLLLGGGVRQLMKIVTAFTAAHSLTLVLAVLNLVSPPARLVEPAIALSVIFVGAHALLRREEQRDWRLLFAFCFGLIHGFGFAGVLREMELPPQALGWSLVSFNVGVELGQACIVAAVCPLLSVLHRHSVKLGARVVAGGSAGVMLAGTYWLVQRLLVSS